MSFDDDFAEQQVSAASPSEKVFLTLTGTRAIQVRFAPGYYQRASTSDMEAQLSRAARLLFVERTRAMYAGLSAEAGERVEPGRDRLHRDARTYRERLDELTASGSSAGGEVTLISVGLGAFTVTIAPGTLDRLSEEQFIAAGQATTLAYIADFDAKLALLKYDVYYRERLEAAGLG